MTNDDNNGNDVNVPIKTSFVDVDITSPASDKTTTNISNSSPTEKQISKEKNENKFKKENTEENKQKSIVILKDKMLKHINGWEISKRLESDCKVYVMYFSGARAKWMKDF